MASPIHIRPIDRTSSVTAFPLDHPYVELVWMPITGPTAIAVLRRAALLLAEHPDGHDVDAAELAASLGIGHRSDVESHLTRTLVRLDRFGLARWTESTGVLEVFTTAHRVPDRLVERLPAAVRAVHDSLTLSAGVEPVLPTFRTARRDSPGLGL